MVGLFKDIREFFWPLLEKDDESKTSEYREEDCQYDDKEIDDLIKLAKEYQASEDDRRKEVESKASIFIGTFAVATTIMLSLAKDFMKDAISFTSFLNIAIVVITIIYLCRAICFSIRCLSRRNYRAFGFPKYLLKNQNPTQKKRKILLQLVNDVRVNQDVINDKVGQMVMAQLYFKRAVVSVGLLTVVIFIEAIINGVIT